MAGHANFFRIKNTIRNASSVHIIKPNEGVSKSISKKLKFQKLIPLPNSPPAGGNGGKKYCIRRPVLWMQ
jgi:hypothetical protein